MTDDGYREKHRRAREQAITVAELREHLAVFNGDELVIFSETDAGDPLVFVRVKHRGQSADGELVQIELRTLEE